MLSTVTFIYIYIYIWSENSSPESETKEGDIGRQFQSLSISHSEVDEWTGDEC